MKITTKEKELAIALLFHHKFLEQNSKENDIEAVLELAYRSLFGVCAPINLSKAGNLLMQAIEMDASAADPHLAFYVTYVKLSVKSSGQKGLPQEYIMALQLLQKLSADGNQEAKIFCLRKSDSTYWKEYYQKNKKDIYANYILHCSSSSVPSIWKSIIKNGKKYKDTAIYAQILLHSAKLEEKIEYYQSSMELGHLSAVYVIADFYQNINQNEEAKKLYYFGTQFLDPESFYQLACCYYTEEKFTLAEKYYTAAYRLGHSEAGTALGLFILKKSHENRYPIGIELLKQEGDKGSGQACYSLYKIYNRGLYGEEKKAEEAKKWLEKSANFGDERAKKIIENQEKKKEQNFKLFCHPEEKIVLNNHQIPKKLSI